MAKMVYESLHEAKVTAWWDKVNNSLEKPTEEQKAFLQCVIDRCRAERAELLATSASPASVPQKFSESLRSLLLGIPGAGKSTCLKLLRSFFEDVLNWEDGVQFQYLATQNTMAALIGGLTVHGWGVIPVNAEDANRKAIGPIANFT